MVEIDVDDICGHGPYVHRVSSHEDLTAALKTDEPVSSVWVCADADCVRHARAWVHQQTRRHAVVVVKAGHDARMTDGLLGLIEPAA